MKKKRVRLLVISSCAHLNQGGQPISVLNIALHLAEKGVDIHLLTAIKPGHVAIKTLESRGVKVHTLPISDNRFFGLVFSIFCIFWGMWLIRCHKIRIVQIHAPSSAIIGTILKLVTKVKLILVTHGLWRGEKVKVLPQLLRGFGERSLTKMEKFVYSYIDAFISPVNFDVFTPYLIGMGVKRKIIYETNFGPPVYKFKEEKKKELPDELPGAVFEKKLVFVGKFDGTKGQEVLIKAAPAIIKKEPRVGMIFVGDGPILKRCKSLTQSLCIDKNVVFTGSRDDSDEFLKVADVVVSHISPIEIYGVGTAQREAIYLKTPLVTKEDPIQRKFFEDAITYVDPKSINDVSEKIIFLLKNTNEATKMANCAYELLTEKFNWDKYIEVNMEIYSKILNNQQSSHAEI